MRPFLSTHVLSVSTKGVDADLPVHANTVKLSHEYEAYYCTASMRMTFDRAAHTHALARSVSGIMGSF